MSDDAPDTLEQLVADLRELRDAVAVFGPSAPQIARRALERAENLQERPSLFQRGDYRLHSGTSSTYKIECGALTHEDWATLALLASQRLPAYGAVYGIPEGGKPFERALREHKSNGPTLVCDDVLTTGGNMVRTMRGFDEALGVVAFARGPVPPGVVALFALSP